MDNSLKDILQFALLREVMPTIDGCRKGGKTTYQKYPHIFEKLHHKHDFDIGLELSTDLCEFVGAFIGDGFTGRYGGNYLTQFTGDARYEWEYFKYSLAPIAQKLFNIDASLRAVGNTLRMNLRSKSLYFTSHRTISDAA